MRHWIAPLLAAAALAAGAATAASPAARAGDIASKKIWMLEFEHQKPFRVTIGKEPHLENYWVLPFTLANPDAEDHGFFLEVAATDDKGHHYRSLAHPIVKDIARRRLGVREGDALWSHEDLTIPGEPTDPNAPFPRKLNLPVIKAGEKVRCVAIFEGWHREADRLVVTVRGLTNDAIVTRTAPHERKIVERVLELHFARPGDEYYRTEDPIELAGRKWVNVERTIKTDLE